MQISLTTLILITLQVSTTVTTSTITLSSSTVTVLPTPAFSTNHAILPHEIADLAVQHAVYSANRGTDRLHRLLAIRALISHITTRLLVDVRLQSAAGAMALEDENTARSQLSDWDSRAANALVAASMSRAALGAKASSASEEAYATRGAEERGNLEEARRHAVAALVWATQAASESEAIGAHLEEMLELGRIVIPSNVLGRS